MGWKFIFYHELVLTFCIWLVGGIKMFVKRKQFLVNVVIVLQRHGPLPQNQGSGPGLRFAHAWLPWQPTAA
jgi:hypothetical protein